MEKATWGIWVADLVIMVMICPQILTPDLTQNGSYFYVLKVEDFKNSHQMMLAR